MYNREVGLFGVNPYRWPDSFVTAFRLVACVDAARNEQRLVVLCASRGVRVPAHRRRSSVPLLVRSRPSDSGITTERIYHANLCTRALTRRRYQLALTATPELGLWTFVSFHVRDQTHILHRTGVGRGLPRDRRRSGAVAVDIIAPDV